MTTKAFVAGATGYTGQNVVQQLREQGIECVAHVRPTSSRLDEWTQKFEALGAVVNSADWELDAMTAALKDLAPTHVFFLIGTTRARAKRNNDPDETYMSVDYALASMMIKACVASGHNPKFIYLSSLGVTESAPSAYLKARFLAESELVVSGLPYIIARPSFITGEDRDEDRPMERIGSAVADGALGVLGALGMTTTRDRYQSLSGAELAEGLIHWALADDTNIEVDTVRLRLV